MEEGQGPKWGCSTREKKRPWYSIKHSVALLPVLKWRVRVTLWHECPCTVQVWEVRRRFRHKFRGVAFRNKSSVNSILYTFRQMGSLLNKKESSQRAECPLKRNGFQVRTFALKNPSDTPCNGDWDLKFQVSVFRFSLFPERNFSARIWIFCDLLAHCILEHGRK
jgi:hypothetical protein